MFCNSCVWACLLWEFNFLGVPRHSCLPVKHFHVNPQVRGSQGFPSGASGKESACQCRRCKRLGFALWAWKIPWRKALQPTLVFLPGESCGQRNLAGWGGEESDTTEATSHTHTHTHMVPNQTPLTHGLMTWLFTHWWSSHACWWFPSRPLVQRDSAPSYRQPWVCLGPWIHKSCLNCCSFVALDAASPASSAQGESFKGIGKIRGEMNT